MRPHQIDTNSTSYFLEVNRRTETEIRINVGEEL